MAKNGDKLGHLNNFPAQAKEKTDLIWTIKGQNWKIVYTKKEHLDFFTKQILCNKMSIIYKNILLVYFMFQSI
jgi:hypothetical protein